MISCRDDFTETGMAFCSPFLLCMLMAFLFCSGAYSICLEDQKTLLLQLRTQLQLQFNSSLSTKLVKWNRSDDQDCCGWGGVRCDAVGHVVSLDLFNEGLWGGVSDSSVLFNLSELISLRLSYNSLSGPIPSFHLLKKLRFLDLSDNRLTGSLHSIDFGRIYNLTSLNLARNLLSGSIPEPLFRIPSLEMLSLSHNCFSGPVNELRVPHSSGLQLLDLSSNRLQGPIPHSFFKLKYLHSLFLSYNSFNGTLRLGESPSVDLSWLDLSYNNLSIDASSINSSSFSTLFPQLEVLRLGSCNLYTFPDLRNQSRLLELDLSNNAITGEIPSWVWELNNGFLYFLNLSVNMFVGLQRPYHVPEFISLLDLHSNQLRGELPSMTQQMAYYIDYSNNEFEGSLPLNSLSASFISLANNSLSGIIPPSLCNSTHYNLTVLDLSGNKLSGNIPPCLVRDKQQLRMLNLAGNHISGKIPDSFSKGCSLQWLDLSNNNLQGNIPPSLANCESLESMNVRGNKIEGSFPCMIPPSLQILVLRSNRFGGEVRCHWKWPNLQILDIAHNNFSGDLHLLNFSSWGGMIQQHLTASTVMGYQMLAELFYRITMTLTLKGLELKLPKISTLYTVIDLSCNNFQGQIPDAIGDLVSLHAFNLSHNRLTGTIPKSFGNLRQLESMDLSMNRLTGEIPRELADLTFLGVLNLSYNKLVGEIPPGHQLQTFSASSFRGNTGLCGFPLDRSCNVSDGNGGSGEGEQSAKEDEEEEIQWRYVSVALGFVVGLGSILWMLFGCESMSARFSEKADEILGRAFKEEDRKRKRKRKRRDGRRK